jgi:hypothetical protein
MDPNIGLNEKRQSVRLKLGKIAQNCDHNIDPSHCFAIICNLFWACVYIWVHKINEKKSCNVWHDSSLIRMCLKATVLCLFMHLGLSQHIWKAIRGRVLFSKMIKFSFKLFMVLLPQNSWLWKLMTHLRGYISDCILIRTVKSIYM